MPQQTNDNQATVSLNDKSNIAQRKLESYSSFLENSIFFDTEVDHDDDSFFMTNLTRVCENDPQTAFKLQLSKHNSMPI